MKSKQLKANTQKRKREASSRSLDRMVSLVAVRAAVANYMSSEGCSCCQGGDHEEHRAAVAKLLRVGKYKDGSGYNFTRYEANDRVSCCEQAENPSTVN